MDTLISEYAALLERIYENRTAGDYTFEGVLSLFANRVLEVQEG
jgi:hypothetical protein